MMDKVEKRIEYCVQSISDTPAENSIFDDAIARVLGPEHRERARGFGFGVAPSKVDGQIQSNGRVRELEGKVGALEEKSQHGSGIHGGIAHTKNARCQLLHWYTLEEEEIVAKGRIASTDPSAKVHHVPIRRDCWKVWVEEVYMGHLNLYRLTDEFRVLSEAIGSTIAWPKSSIGLI
ncbi:Hypothetical predicted protein [Olea europaea subsp. europaea]|uniref:DUF8039 domain-containing protein n=1 Tax=Olea europaea subsp. europaea TaxID=158383 RepID=A0A8S0VFR4_OLEEU|nr:Hypothetical predicted protein [Olea europaea subsp. europaea]